MKCGCSPATAILAFIGMAGGAYYLYNKKGAANKPPRVPNSNPDFVAKNELPGEPDTQRLQDLAKDLAINDLTKNLTKDQKNLIADQKDLYKAWLSRS